MRKEIVLFIGALFVGSCSSHFSGSLVEQDVSGAQGTAPTRAGAVPYRNDASVAARKDDALKKIARFCGSDSYTITGEGALVCWRKPVPGRIPMRRVARNIYALTNTSARSELRRVW
jgi:hypothetical protein